MTDNEWQKTHGARRRQIDRELLAEVERQIAALDDAAPPQDVNFTPAATRTPKTQERELRASPEPQDGRPPSPVSFPSPTQEQASWLDGDARAAIARAFGRPLA
jgi:hypothetical protein